jgi:hypothetical protein
MKSIAFLLILSLCEAQAGFRHPIEENGEQARAIQATPVAAAKAGPSSDTYYGPALPEAVVQAQKTKTDRAPAEVKSTSKTGSPSGFWPKHIPWTKIEKAPELPSNPTFQVKGVSLPSRELSGIKKDSLPIYDLKGLNKEQVLAFARKALAMPMPKSDPQVEAKAAEIVARYKDALQIVPHKTIRTPLRIHISQTTKILLPPPPITYENMVKRIDALFLGLNLNYQAASFSLWELSQAKDNHKEYQPRDAVFAGLLARRAGWENASRYLYKEAVLRKIEMQDRYLRILWSELESFENFSFIEDAIREIDLEKVRLVAPIGDKANFALARLVLAKNNKPLETNFLEERIASSQLRQRFALTKAIKQLRDPKAGKTQAIDRLRELEASAEESIRQEARLALARALMSQGNTSDALQLYELVKKDGRNRLELMAEQAYAEYRAGHHQVSLGKSLGLQSPYFQYGFAPDIHIIEVLNRKQLCDFGGADLGIQRFAERYGRELAALDGLLARKPNAAEFYRELISYHGYETPYRHQRYLLHLSTVMENQKLLNYGEQELQRLHLVGTKKHERARPENWGIFLEELSKNWDKLSLAYKVESAETALAEVEYMAKRLRHSFSQAELLGLDVSTAAAKDYNLQNALNFPARRPAAQEALAKDKFHWPFEQEIWEDEIDFLKMKNPSKCASVAKNP